MSNERIIQLYCYDTGSAGEQELGEGSAAGADFDDRLGTRERECVDDAREGATIGEKVLAKSAAQLRRTTSVRSSRSGTSPR